MTNGPGSSSGSGRTARRNVFSASVFNATTLVSIFVVAIFAVVTQLLAASGAISLSTTLQLTMWLVALGFIVLLAIAYMFFRVFERVFEAATTSPAKHDGNAGTWRRSPDANGQKRTDAQEDGPFGHDAGSPTNPTDGPPQFMPGWIPDGSALKGEDTWVPPDDLRYLHGSEYSVSTEEVFPDGCYLEPDSIKRISDRRDGLQVYECRVVDRNPALTDRPHETVVKILANQEPSQASIARFGRVEFEHLTITPYLTDQNPMSIRYSLHATGLHPAAAPAEREQATWTVPPVSDVPPPRPPEETEAHIGMEDASSGAADPSS
jgi:hypothetical protein